MTENPWLSQPDVEPYPESFEEMTPPTAEELVEFERQAADDYWREINTGRKEAK